MIQQVSFGVFIIILFSISSYSFGEESDFEETPSLELFEFLAEFKSDSDEWIDPIALEERVNETDETHQNMEQKNEDD